MKGLKELLIKEKTRLEKIERKTRGQLENVPEGRLRISKSNNHTQFYHYTEESVKGRGRYLSNSEADLIHRLAQKQYDEKILDLARRRLKQINSLLKNYDDNEIEEIYINEHIERKKIITPVEMTWEQIIMKWEAEKYDGKSFNVGEKVIFSEKGERVRSKSEKIIADYLYRNKIPYKYEKPLHLKGYGTVYPDFTLMSRKTYNEIYWEHYGMMDVPAYACSAVKKIKTYEENGIYIGEKLIVTFETQDTIMNTKDIERNLERAY